jgi:hypothetical protein
VPTAEAALRKAPGVLAVKVDDASQQATIGTANGKNVPKKEILKELEAVKYKGTFSSNE